jgi:hypothetical protein
MNAEVTLIAILASKFPAAAKGILTLIYVRRKYELYVYHIKYNLFSLCIEPRPSVSYGKPYCQLFSFPIRHMQNTT